MPWTSSYTDPRTSVVAQNAYIDIVNFYIDTVQENVAVTLGLWWNQAAHDSGAEPIRTLTVSTSGNAYTTNFAPTNWTSGDLWTKLAALLPQDPNLTFLQSWQAV